MKPNSLALSAALLASLLIPACNKPAASTAGAKKTVSKPAEPPLTAEDIRLRFGIARTSIGFGRYGDAAEQLSKLTAQKAAEQPQLSWMTLYQGLALQLAGRDEDARTTYKSIEERNWNGDGPGAQKLAKFFLTVAAKMGAEEKIPSEISKDYDKSGYEAFALLLYGIKDWNLGEHEEGSSLFRQFSSAYIKAPEQWVGPEEDIRRIKELVDQFEDAFSIYLRVNTELDRAKTPEDKIAAVESFKKARPKIKVLGKMTKELDEKVALIEPEARETVEKQTRMANEDLEFDAKALPEAKAKRTALLGEMRFEEARQAILAPDLRTEGPRDEQQRLATKTQWLVSFKSSLMEDLNKKGYPAPVALKNGTTISSGILKVNDKEIEFRGKPAPAPVPWTEIAPEELFKIALSFIPEDLAPYVMAHHKWHAGTYAIFIGKSEVGKKLATEASELNPVFKEALPLLMGGAPAH